MSKVENIKIQIKNAKIKSEHLQKICYCFSKDYTAIETAKLTGFSRQTINHYYKLIRTKLFENSIITDYKKVNSLLKEDSLEIKHLKIYNYDVFYIQNKEGIFILDKELLLPNNLDSYLKKNIKDSLIKHKKANCARILHNKRNDSYITSGFLKSDNSFELFIQQRLRKFRGINKNNFYMHLKECLFRYNYNNNDVYKKVLYSFI